MPDRQSPRPAFAVRLRIFVSNAFDAYELKDIGWRKFFNGPDTDLAKTPAELACKAFIDLMLAPEVEAGHNDYPVRIMNCLFGYLADQYGRWVSREQVNDLGKRWNRFKAGASKGTAPMREWFDEAYRKEEWPRKPKLF